MKILNLSSPALFAYWLVFLATKLEAWISGGWFVWNATTTLGVLAEVTFLSLLLSRRTTAVAALGSIAFLTASLAYHAAEAAMAPNSPCGCTGSIKTTHVDMITLSLVGIGLAVATLYSTQQRAVTHP